MRGKNLLEFLKHLNYISLSVPVGILAASAIFPLQTLVRQAMICILLIWFGIEAMRGFPFFG